MSKTANIVKCEDIYVFIDTKVILIKNKYRRSSSYSINIIELDVDENLF